MKLTLLTILFTFSAFGQGVFQKGAGAEYELTGDGDKENLSIYIANAKGNKIGVEYHFHSDSQAIEGMYLQYHLEINKKQRPKVVAGYIQHEKSKKSEKLLNLNFILNDYLFPNRFFMNKSQMGFNSLETVAGTVETTAYQIVNGDQIIDVWVTEDLQPIGLVKLVSTNAMDKSQNFKLELKTLHKEKRGRVSYKKRRKLSKKSEKISRNPIFSFLERK